MFSIAALVLASSLATSIAANLQQDDKALATELLALAEAPARERWPDLRRAQITASLGREFSTSTAGMTWPTMRSLRRTGWPCQWPPNWRKLSACLAW